MEKISIENIFNHKTGKSSQIDVESIGFKSHQQNFDVVKLVETREKAREILLAKHLFFLKECHRQITVANSSGKTDLIFCVKKYCTDVPQYNSLDCLDFISRRLASNYIDSFIINNTSLFVSWMYLESNIKKYASY
jgi:hypothetical protein